MQGVEVAFGRHCKACMSRHVALAHSDTTGVCEEGTRVQFLGRGILLIFRQTALACANKLRGGTAGRLLQIKSRPIVSRKQRWNSLSWHSCLRSSLDRDAFRSMAIGPSNVGVGSLRPHRPRWAACLHVSEATMACCVIAFAWTLGSVRVTNRPQLRPGDMPESA